MSVVTKHIELSTQGNAETLNITPQLYDALEETEMQDGVLTVFVPGATGAVTTVEFEPGLIQDFEELWENIIPSNITYNHDQTWNDGNGYSHIRASLLGPSLSIPFCTGKFTLGTWQQVVFIDFDNRSRSRKLILQFVGEL
jgi:secondary thiamine-phosphate synthase enzyme